MRCASGCPTQVEQFAGSVRTPPVTPPVATVEAFDGGGGGAVRVKVLKYRRRTVRAMERALLCRSRHGGTYRRCSAARLAASPVVFPPAAADVPSESPP